MKLSVLFEATAWDDYMYWYETDRKILPKINGLLKNASAHLLKESVSQKD